MQTIFQLVFDIGVPYIVVRFGPEIANVVRAAEPRRNQVVHFIIGSRRSRNAIFAENGFADPCRDVAHDLIMVGSTHSGQSDGLCGSRRKPRIGKEESIRIARRCGRLLLLPMQKEHSPRHEQHKRGSIGESGRVPIAAMPSRQRRFEFGHSRLQERARSFDTRNLGVRFARGLDEIDDCGLEFGHACAAIPAGAQMRPNLRRATRGQLVIGSQHQIFVRDVK